MKLTRNTASFFAWLFVVVKQFFRSNPVLTAQIVSISVFARIVTIVSFLLPLKVILLAGSERIPRYFPFIDQAHRTEWIIGLSVGALVLYFFTLWLEVFRTELADRGGGQILRASTTVKVNSNHEDDAKSVYLRIITVVTNMVFFVAAASVLAVLDHRVALWLATYILAAYLAFALLTSSPVLARFPGLDDKLLSNIKKYLRIGSSIGFLSSFLVILYTLLTAPEPNIAIAIVLFILMRHVLNATLGVALEGVQMSGKRDEFNAILFREHQWRASESKESHSLREVFSASRRVEVAARELQDQIQTSQPLFVRWIDPAPKSIQCFEIRATSKDGTPFRAIQAVYRSTQRHLMANEDYLFSFVRRRDLGVPEVIKDFSAGAYTSRILAANGSTDVSQIEWDESLPRLLTRMWSFKPSPEMVEGYRATHPLLEERLDRTLLKKLSVAIDLDEEKRAYYAILARLPSIQARLKTLPMVLTNPDLARGNSVFRPESGELGPILWGNWQLARLGSDVGLEISPEARGVALARAGDAREDIGNVPSEDVRFSELCGNLEKLIELGSYKAAFGLIVDLLASLTPSIASELAVG